MLLAPKSYFMADEQLKKEVCNGCGREGWKGKLVPETIYGLNISQACNIHDWMYYEKEDRKFADLIFKKNMFILINEKKSPLNPLRKARAYTYYLAVRIFGSKAWNAN